MERKNGLANKFRQVTYRVNKHFRQTLTSSSIVEGVASPGFAEDGDAVISVDREKHMQEREKGVRTLRSHYNLIKTPITIFGEKLVGHNAKVRAWLVRDRIWL